MTGEIGNLKVYLHEIDGPPTLTLTKTLDNGKQFSYIITYYWTVSRFNTFPASILYKSTASRYRPVSYPDEPITARYRFMKNAYWVHPEFIK